MNSIYRSYESATQSTKFVTQQKFVRPFDSTLRTHRFSFVIGRRSATVVSSIIIYIGSKLWFPAFWLDTLSFVVLSHCVKNVFSGFLALAQHYHCTHTNLFIYILRLSMNLIRVDSVRSVVASDHTHTHTHWAVDIIISWARTTQYLLYSWSLLVKSEIEKFLGQSTCQICDGEENHYSLISRTQIYSSRRFSIFFFLFIIFQCNYWIRFGMRVRPRTASFVRSRSEKPATASTEKNQFR